MQKNLVIITVDRTNNEKVMRLMVRRYPNKVAGSFDYFGRTTTVQVTGITGREVDQLRAVLKINLGMLPPICVKEIEE